MRRNKRPTKEGGRARSCLWVLFFIAVVPLLAFPFFVPVGSATRYMHISNMHLLRGDQKQHPHLNKAETTTRSTSNSISSTAPLLVISYSLYGQEQIYTEGMINAARRSLVVFPEWQVRIYHDSKVPTLVLRILRDIGPHVKLINVEKDLPDWVHELNPMAWRFLVASDPSVDAYIIRDGDSRPSFRDKAAVNEWLLSGKAFHVIRDHPMHNPTTFAPILGGMWGGLHRGVPQMDQLLRIHYGGGQRIRYAEDQNFLWQNIMPLAYNDCLQHDSYYCRESNAVTLPVHRNDGESPNEYVGNDHALKDEFVEDWRLKAGEYVEKYESCWEDRKRLESQFGSNFALLVNTTFIGHVTGSSTEVWAEFNRKRREAQGIREKGQIAKGKLGGFGRKLKHKRRQ